MRPESPADYLHDIRDAAKDALAFVADLTPIQFAEDRKSQRAAVMCLIIMGEASARLIERFPAFIAAHSEIPWRSMRGMRNRMTHGYFEIDPQVVWMTLTNDLPDLLKKLNDLKL